MVGEARQVAGFRDETEGSAYTLRMRLLLALLPLVLAAEKPVDLRTAGLELVRVKTEPAAYRGKKALHVFEAGVSGETLAILQSSDFGDGEIELEVAGTPAKGALEGARGFVGIAFRLAAPNDYEAFYVRPTNGRADDQLRRNHATQYVSHPQWTWQKFRTEFPGKYESYTDLEAGAWTHLRVTVEGVKARLYVNRAPQPCLIVNDLRKGARRGKIALWIGDGTDAHFANLRVRSTK